MLLLFILDPFLFVFVYIKIERYRINERESSQRTRSTSSKKIGSRYYFSFVKNVSRVSMGADVKETGREKKAGEWEKKKKNRKKKKKEKKEKERDVQLWNSNKVLNKCRDGFEVGKMDEREFSSRKPLELWQVSSLCSTLYRGEGEGDKK